MMVAAHASLGRPDSTVKLVTQYQRYAGEEGLGVAFGSLWVSSVDNGASVARMSLATSKSVSIPAASDEDTQIGIAPGAVWMSDFGDGIVRRIDPATNKVTATTKGLLGASGFAFSGDDVWVALHHAQAVAELNGQTGRVLARLAVPSPGGGVVASGPGSVVVGFGSVWTSVPNIAALVRLDPATHKVLAVIHDGADCCDDGVVAGDSIWVRAGGSVDRIDPKTNTVTARIHLAATSDGLTAPLVVLDGRLWAASGDTIVAIDPSTARVISRTVIAKAYFKDLAAANGALWAWDESTNEIDELRAS
jgi:streptogramin lyase